MKKAVLVVLVLFALWAIAEHPQKMADATSTAASSTWEMTQSVFSSAFDFLGALFD